MKVAYIHSSTIPSRSANSIHVMKMCQALAKTGNEVMLIAPIKNEKIEKGIKNIFEYYGVKKCFDIARYPWLNIKYGGYLYAVQAATKAKLWNAEVIYSRHIAGSYISSLFGLTIIIELHEPIDEGGRKSKWMFKKLINYNGFRKLVVITNALKKYYEDIYPSLKGRIHVAPDCADPIKESNKTIKLNNNKKCFRAGYVGNLYQGRGIDLIIELAKRVNWDEFHIIGGKEEDLKYWNTQIKGIKNIILHGFIRPSEVNNILLEFDVLLAPYQYEVSIDGKGDTVKWMSPLKIFEYMATGKPIICSDLPVLREVLKHEYNALLCKPDDVNAWLHSLKRLKYNSAISYKIGNNAYNDFINNYTWISRANSILKYY